jgi:hypothetical protein
MFKQAADRKLEKWPLLTAHMDAMDRKKRRKQKKIVFMLERYRCFFLWQIKFYLLYFPDPFHIPSPCLKSKVFCGSKPEKHKVRKSVKLRCVPVESSSTVAATGCVIMDLYVGGDDTCSGGLTVVKGKWSPRRKYSSIFFQYHFDQRVLIILLLGSLSQYTDFVTGWMTGRIFFRLLSDAVVPLFATKSRSVLKPTKPSIE